MTAASVAVLDAQGVSMTAVVEVTAGLTGVTAASYSGLEILGTVGGVLGGVAAVVALIVSVAAGNAKRRHQYEDDIRAAEARGEARAVARAAELADDLAEIRGELAEYRTRYLNLLEIVNRRGGGG